MSIDKLDRFGISYYRSFDETGVYFENLKKINLLIGKNNCGKSNVFKFFKTLANIKSDCANFPATIENFYRQTNRRPKMYFKYTLKDLNIPEFVDLNLTKQRVDKYLLNEIVMRLDFDHDKFTIDDPFIKSSFNQFNIETTVRHYISDSINQKLNIQVSKSQWDALVQHFDNYIHKLLRDFVKQIIYIPDFRYIQEGLNAGSYNTVLNGSNIISQMFEMQQPDVGEHRRRVLFDEIQNVVRKMLEIDNLLIEIPHKKDKMILNINGNRLPLESFGTGIHQTILMCSALLANENYIAFIEEPEIHLHPELQRKFFKFLLTTNNQYFITTHSNVFLDSSFEDVSIYHLKNDGEKTTLLRQETSSHKLHIINDLGYRTSDLLQSNGIIWVEGPSDRIYINKWLSLKNNEFKEGIHYSIMFYGGKLLSHLTFEQEILDTEFIELLKINKNSYVVIDADRINNITKTKIRICQEIGESKYWLTKGKEIENYLTKSTLNKWLESKNLPLIENELNKQDKIDNILNSVSINYSAKKAQYSKEISQHVVSNDLITFDLNKKITEILSNITIWNN